MEEKPVRFILLAFLLALPAAGEGFYAYRLRGEVRLLFFWKGRDNVGGGHISIGRVPLSANRWREEIEVLFGSHPERIPGRINRWGYGREAAEWAAEDGIGAPRLTSTELRGIMRHSNEASAGEALAATQEAAARGQYLYDASLSTVLPGSAWHEFRVLAAPEDFHYRSPRRLLGSFERALVEMPAARRGHLAHGNGAYGFLTGLQELIRRVSETRSRQSLGFVFNSKLYTLEALSCRPVPESAVRAEWRASGARDLAQVAFRSFNTVKRTRTDFELWLPMAGKLKGIPVRIVLQPRWWLRLQMDLDRAGSGGTAGVE